MYVLTEPVARSIEGRVHTQQDGKSQLKVYKSGQPRTENTSLVADPE
jgi:hypothetical protein